MFITPQKQNSKTSYIRSTFFKAIAKINKTSTINSVWLLSLLQTIHILIYLSLNLKHITKVENSSLRYIQYCLPSYLIQEQYVSSTYFYFGIVVTIKMFIAAFFMVMFKNKVKGILVKVAGFGRIVVYYMAPIFGDIIAYAVLRLDFQKSYGFFYLYFLVLILVGFVMAFMMIRLQIYPFRSLSSFWSLNNAHNLQYWMVTLFKSIQISLFGPSLSINFIGIIFYFYSSRYSKGYLNPKMNIFALNLIESIYIIDLAFILLGLGVSQQILLILVPMILVIFFIKKAINIYLKSTEIIYLPSCKSKPQQFYNFYYQFQQKDKNTQNLENNQLIMIHFKNCGQNCKVNEDYNLSSKLNIYQTVTNILQRNKNVCNKNLLLFQLWKVQNKTITKFQNFKKRQISLQQEFIIVCMEQYIINQRNNQNISEDIALITDNYKSDYFLQQLSQFIDIYLKCYEQLLKPTPSIDQITYNGMEIIKRMSKIQSIYRELYTLKRIGYQMKVLYFQICQILNKHSASNPKLEQNKIDLQYQNISSCSLPTFEIDKDNGTIIDVNCEGSKLMKLSKKQLRFKKIVDFLHPEIELGQIIKAIARKDIYAYVKHSIKVNYQFCRVQISVKVVENKPRIILQFFRFPQKPTQNKILINQQFKILYMKRQQISLGIQPNFQPTPWQKIFQNYISPKKQDIQKRQCLKLSIPQTTIHLLIRKFPTLQKSFNILYIKVFGTGYEQRKQIMKQTYRLIKQSRKMQKSQNSFNFTFQDFDKRLRLIGCRELSSLCLIQSQKSRFNINLSSSTEQAINPSFQLQQQIFTYRLWNGEIYNIDLEDKQGYQNMFEGRPQIKQYSMFDNHKMTKIFMVIIVVIFTIIFGIQLGFLLKINNLQKQISDGIKQMQMLNIFNIDYSRLIAILRDWANNLSQNYPQIDFMQQLKSSKQSIETYINGTLIFDSSITKMSFQNYQFQGSISQLSRVILSQIDRFIAEKQDEIIQSIHNSFIIQLNPIMQVYQLQRQIQLRQNIQQSINLLQLFAFSNIAFFVITTIVFVMYIRTLVKINYDTIQPLMKIKPNIFQINKLNGEKLKSKIQLMKKKIQTQIVLQNITKQKSINSYAKKTKLSDSIINILIITIIVSLIIYIVTILGGKMSFDNVINNISIRSEAEKVLTQIYPKFCSLTNSIEHLQRVNMTKIEQIYEMLKLIRETSNQPLFSSNLNNFLNDIYLSNSCQKIIQNGINLDDCSNLFRGFSVRNPFQIGLLNFYHRQATYLTTNITESFAFTGILSKTFVEVYNLISEKINGQLIKYISDMNYVPYLFVSSIVTLTLIQIIIFWRIASYFQKQTRRIIEVTSLLIATTPKEIEPQIKEHPRNQISRSEFAIKQSTSIKQIILTKRRSRLA